MGRQFPFAFGPYEVLAELGRGAASIVYKARDAVLNRVVTLKVLAPTASSEKKQRFLRDAQVWAALTHDESEPNIPALHQVGEDRGQPFCAREFVDGRTLELVLTGAITLGEAINALATIARTVQRVHDRGIVHPNLHPSNILITADGTPKLIGFGLVVLLAGSGRLPPGTPGVSVAVDIQALGRLLRWLSSTLCGSIPEPLQAVCSGCAPAGSAARFASAAEFANALARCCSPL